MIQSLLGYIFFYQELSFPFILQLYLFCNLLPTTDLTFHPGASQHCRGKCLKYSYCKYIYIFIFIYLYCSHYILEYPTQPYSRLCWRFHYSKKRPHLLLSAAILTLTTFLSYYILTPFLSGETFSISFVCPTPPQCMSIFKPFPSEKDKLKIFPWILHSPICCLVFLLPVNCRMNFSKVAYIHMSLLLLNPLEAGLTMTFFTPLQRAFFSPVLLNVLLHLRSHHSFLTLSPSFSDTLWSQFFYHLGCFFSIHRPLPSPICPPGALHTCS